MLDLSRSIRSLLEGAIDQARLAQQEQRWNDAAAGWDEAARLSQTMADSSRNDQEKAMRARAAAEFRAVASQIRSRPKTSGAQHPSDASSSTIDSTEELASAIQSFRHRSNIGWGQIAGLEDTVRMIQSAYALSLAQSPTGVQLRARHNMLFYGPPGCGKSLLAAAASHGLDAVFFNVPVSGLVSKWFGESAKLVSALYREARHHPISLVFLDEIDALAANRDRQDSNASRQILANLLSELDGVSTKDHPHTVITIAATNSPWDLDAAILSRFSRRIYIPLPDAAARRRMFEILLLRRGFELAVPLNSLVDRTDGWSGREIEQICQSLIERMLWRENPDLSELALQGRAALSAYTVSVWPIRAEDIDFVLDRSVPQTPVETLAKYQRWGNGST